MKKEELIKIAVAVARETPGGYSHVTLSSVAERAQISSREVSDQLGGQAGLRSAIALAQPVRRMACGNDRKNDLLQAALRVALLAAGGYSRMTKEEIAKEAGCAPALVNRHFGTMPNLRRDVMRAAVREGNAAVVAQGLALKDPHAQKAPQALKEEAAALLAQ